MHALFHAGEAMCNSLMAAVPQRRTKQANADVTGLAPGKDEQ